MSQSMYTLSVPRFTNLICNLKSFLEKAIAYSVEKNIADDVLPASRIIADMYPLSTQVQIVCDQAKGCVARLAGIEAPTFEDSEKTLPELITRIEKTLAFLETVKAEQLDGTELKDIHLSFPSITLDLKGAVYLHEFTLPNMYFHLTTAYNILRQNGLELGKRDFIGNITQ
ncbi:DUF1993 family protein [Aurantivibrio infirmus]